MARFALVAVTGLVGILALQQAAGAQNLRTLHVRDFAMSVDRAVVPVGEVFHLTIRARVAEPVGSLDEIALPNLAAFEELGDERRCATASAATECSETLTLEALTAGDVTIAPASLDAVDGRNGRPSRFITNTVALRIVGTRLGTALQASFGRAIRLTARIAILVALLAAATLAFAWIRLRSERKRPSVAPPLPSAPNAPHEDFGVRLRELVQALTREPTRARAVALRAALRENAGAREDETLADLRQRGALDGTSGAALAAVERASFCEDDKVADAAREALPYLS
ncbi:MAG: BatD family protein [Candidatus Eremiobacteraeota bacterium]|nr:BatD family protein [Candidatus Eremiobacteraeota bacterium]